MSSAPKYLRLCAEEVELIIVAFNNSRLSIFTAEQQSRLPELRHRLGRYCVATAEELNEDFERRGKKHPLLDEKESILATLRGASR